jgi:hypothetical protein
MSKPDDAEDAENPQSRRAGAREKPASAASLKPTREERLAKALRENIKRRKAANKKD